MKTLEEKERYFNKCLDKAKNKNIPFEVSFEDFLNIFKVGCYFCGSPIDIDETIGTITPKNEKGYTQNNTIGICIDCIGYLHKHNPDDFIKKCREISEYHDSIEEHSGRYTP